MGDWFENELESPAILTCAVFRSAVSLLRPCRLPPRRVISGIRHEKVNSHGL
jgi:hypothetical protein